MFVECKWQTLTANNTRQLFDDLKEKSKYVYWNNEKRQKYFAVVAKKIENKSELRGGGMIVFNLDDIFGEKGGEQVIEHKFEKYMKV